MGGRESWWRRWQRWRAQWHEVLPINRRNLDFVYPHNPRVHFPLADDKLLAKKIFVAEGIPTPETLATYSSFMDLARLEDDLGSLDQFVIKPSQGRAGMGIVVLHSREEEGWRTPGGTLHNLDDLRRHLSDILFGVHSLENSDQVLVEELIHPHPESLVWSPNGLPDIRLILFMDRPVMAMARIPTERSNGKANLHQGAIGLGIDLESGVTNHASFHGHPVETHPTNGAPLVGVAVPNWPQVVDTALRVARAVPLKYLGVDIALSPKGPVVLEINVRPGLEIQNVNNRGLIPALHNA